MKPIKDVETFAKVIKQAKEEHERLCLRGVSLKEIKKQWERVTSLSKGEQKR